MERNFFEWTKKALLRIMSCILRGGINMDKVYLKTAYKLRIHSNLSFKKIETFNEKMQWLKIYDRDPQYTDLVDKYEVRKYIAAKIGEEYLIPLIGVYDSFEQIDFENLPNSFVIKCTHDSGGVFICKNKNTIDRKLLKRKIRQRMRKNYYWGVREWPYKNIKPRIIIEKYMVDESGFELKDYKLMCFNQEVKCSFVCNDRESKDGLKVTFYDRDWNIMPFERHYPKNMHPIAEPNNYEKMIELAEELSKNICFLRVDFYEINSRIYFGELTFFPGSGFEEFSPEKYDLLLGSWLKLPEEKI